MLWPQGSHLFHTRSHLTLLPIQRYVYSTSSPRVCLCVCVLQFWDNFFFSLQVSPDIVTNREVCVQGCDFGKQTRGMDGSVVIDPLSLANCTLDYSSNYSKSLLSQQMVPQHLYTGQLHILSTKNTIALGYPCRVYFAVLGQGLYVRTQTHLSPATTSCHLKLSLSLTNFTAQQLLPEKACYTESNF